MSSASVILTFSNLSDPYNRKTRELNPTCFNKITARIIYDTVVSEIKDSEIKSNMCARVLCGEFSES